MRSIWPGKKGRYASRSRRSSNPAQTWPRRSADGSTRGERPRVRKSASALTQTEDTGTFASLSKMALAEVVQTKGLDALLWAAM